jgi:hypothetical protein
MQGRKRTLSSLGYVLIGLASLCLAEPLLAQGQRPPEEQNASVVVGHGQGLLPRQPSSLTAAERRTLAHTVALVDALGELSSQATGPVSSGTNDKGSSQYGLQIGGVLQMTKRTVVDDRRVVNSVIEVTWPGDSGDPTVPNRIVVENWELTSPPLRDLDVYAFLQNVHAAGVSIDGWDTQGPGVVTVTVSVASSLMHPQASSGLTNVTLLTGDEAHQLHLTDQEWLLPTSMPSLENGPHIIVQQPPIRTTSKPPILETTSPLHLLVVFKPNLAPVNMDSLEVKVKKGFFKISLTERLKPYIQGTMIEASNLQIPAGKFLVEIDIADQKGERTSREYYLKIGDN